MRDRTRLDIEPELAVVYGNEKQPVAGFCIFNDVSARDVQATEFIGGFCLTKDMANGNQLGPYLVTPDEVGDPVAIAQEERRGLAVGKRGRSRRSGEIGPPMNQSTRTRACEARALFTNFLSAVTSGAPSRSASAR